jgi:hypothetical protein
MPIKYGAQVTTTKDGAWSVSQLYQDTPNGPFKRVQQKVIFIDHSEPNASLRLLDALERCLRGKVGKRRNISKSPFETEAAERQP